MLKMTNKRRRTNEYSAHHWFPIHICFACFSALFSRLHKHTLTSCVFLFALHLTNNFLCVFVCCLGHNYVIAFIYICVFIIATLRFRCFFLVWGELAQIYGEKFGRIYMSAFLSISLFTRCHSLSFWLYFQHSFLASVSQVYCLAF